MINLLPKDRRESFMYARRNTKLVRWAVGMVIIVLLMVGLWGTGYLYIASTTSKLNKTINQKREDLKAQKLEETQTRIQDLSNNLKLILQVLSKEVLFSELLQQIGAVMPPGSVLSTMEISKVEGGIDLTAYAKNHQTATQVQVNLEDSRNKLFDKVDLVSVNCAESNSDRTSEEESTGDTSNNPYPCTVVLRALFTKENPFLFIHKSGNGAD